MMKQNKCYASAEILLPDFKKVDAAKWAVVACDQFTSEPEYWQKAEAIVGDAPSTLLMFLPEVYLSEAETRLPLIRSAMEENLAKLLIPHKDAMIYVERTQSDGSVRRGVVLAVDLEQYDYKKGASSMIRATEATVLERIPPRVAIRRGASIELPHIMLLIDDPTHTVIEPLSTKEATFDAYDTDLMLSGGHIRGRFLADDEIASLSVSLDALTAESAMQARYGKTGLAPLLFAVGDGNHSLASAKATYEEIKAAIGAEAAASHPARYALAEVVNIHDDALKFEPIYRVLFGVEPDDVLCELNAYISRLSGDAEPQDVTFVHACGEGNLTVSHPVRQLTVGTLQDFIDEYLTTHKDASVDYIHNEDSLRALACKKNAIGFLFSGMSKDQLFKTVIFDGALPRKTFSMGHAEDKRYYMECRKITKE
ncbi:MAG: DUF1015 domain-containing protein [Clostridia bacterium]|nr:DUF1015 domain-containing protein [Clostridia bacterium]